MILGESQGKKTPNAYIKGTVTTTFFLDLQKEFKRSSLKVPKPESRIPYASILRISRGRGDCQSPSHQAGGRSGVNAHWLRWL